MSSVLTFLYKMYGPLGRPGPTGPLRGSDDVFFLETVMFNPILDWIPMRDIMTTPAISDDEYTWVLLGMDPLEIHRNGEGAATEWTRPVNYEGYNISKHNPRL